MMKNVKMYFTAIIICIIGIIIIVLLTNKCEFSRCDNFKSNGSDYCEEHKCEWEDCTSRKSPGSKYCYYHLEENAKQIIKKYELELTTSQIAQIKQLIKEYTNELMDKQDNVLAVNLLGDTPSTAYTTGITFNCNVVRTDSDTNLATIYIIMNSDGSFKVQSLIYDNE